MSSTNKTTHFQLNSWLGSDIPQREDFNRDNNILDTALHNHITDSQSHTTEQDKSRWNTPYFFTTYLGNGSAQRNIELDCDFDPSWGIIYAVDLTPAVIDFNAKQEQNFFALVSTEGSTPGATLSGRTLTVSQSAVAVLGNEYKSFNETGTTYCCIMFR